MRRNWEESVENEKPKTKNHEISLRLRRSTNLVVAILHLSFLIAFWGCDQGTPESKEGGEEKKTESITEESKVPEPGEEEAPPGKVEENEEVQEVQKLPPTQSVESADKEVGVIELEKGGKIVIEFYLEDAPKTATNFKKLAREGFYNGIAFHRVVPGFVVQGGDPDGTGRGGPGYTVPAEISTRKHLDGTVATARLPDNVNPKRESSGSQFYICLGPQTFLDGQYTIFGQVIEGMDEVRKVQIGDKMKSVTIESR